MIPPVVASERGGAQTGAVFGRRRGCRTALWRADGERNMLESMAVGHESCVRAAVREPSGILSSAGHEKSCVNPPGPSGKAKYSARDR